MKGFSWVILFLVIVLLPACGGGGGGGSDSEGYSVGGTVSGLSGGVVDIAAGDNHSIAVRDDGTVWTWGRNNWKQLGTRTDYYSDGYTALPAQVTGVSDAKDVKASRSGSIVLLKNGTVVNWGYDSDAAPQSVSGLTDVVEITSHRYALKSDGTVWTWGGSNTASQVSGLSNIIHISSKFYSWFFDDMSPLIALKDDGTVWYSNGEQVPDLTDIVEIAGSANNNFYGIKSDRTVWHWRRAANSLSGIDPYQLYGISNIKKLESGGNHVLAITYGDQVLMWTTENGGHLSSAKVNTSPRMVEGLGKVKDIAPGASFSLVLMEDGNIYGWGSNDSLQLAIPKTPEISSYYDVYDSPQRALGVGYPEVKIYMNGGNELAIDENGEFMFEERLDEGDSYSISIQEPYGISCSLQNAGGRIMSNDISNIAINCSGGNQIGGVASLAESYDLVGFEITYANGDVIDQYDAGTYYGTLSIDEDGSASRFLSIDGLTDSGNATFVVEPGGIIKDIAASCQDAVDFSFDGIYLIFDSPLGNCGSDIAFKEFWRVDQAIPVDTDGDGADDVIDDFPTDSARWDAGDTSDNAGSGTDQEPNNTAAAAQAISAPVVITGYAHPDLDEYDVFKVVTSVNFSAVITLKDLNGNDLDVAVFLDDDGSMPVGYPLTDAPFDSPQETFHFTFQAGVPYYVVVEAYDEGSYTLEILQR